MSDMFVLCAAKILYWNLKPFQHSFVVAKWEFTINKRRETSSLGVISGQVMPKLTV